MPFGDGTGPWGGGGGFGWRFGQRHGYGFIQGRHSHTYDLKDELEFLKTRKETLTIKEEDIESRLREIEKLLEKEK